MTEAPVEVSKALLAISTHGLRFTKIADSYRRPPSLNPLNHLGLSEKEGTGFCLDPLCSFVGTNYHVALAKPRRVMGVGIAKRYYATGPNDKGAVLDLSGPVPFEMAPGRDLAIFELRHPIRGHHGIGYSLQELQAGDKVDIYGYPKGPLNPKRSLLKVEGTYQGKTESGLLLFAYSPTGRSWMGPGASGGIVVDRKSQQIVGILCRGGKQEAFIEAVPVQTLAEFVRKVLPWLGALLFPSPAEGAPQAGYWAVGQDLYPKFVPPEQIVLHSRDQSADISALRQSAEELMRNVANFIAVQTFVWGNDSKGAYAEDAYEVRVVDGRQTYREYPDGKKEYEAIPRWWDFGMAPSEDWSQLPRMIGTDLLLRIQRLPDKVVDGQSLRVFQYRASQEDKVCSAVFSLFFGPWIVSSSRVVAACYGEVWTDQETNILRLSQHMDLGGHKGLDWYDTAVTYGWLRLGGKPPRMAPVEFRSQFRSKKETVWCRGHFVNYRAFGSDFKLRVDQLTVLPPADERNAAQEPDSGATTAKPRPSGITNWPDTDRPDGLPVFSPNQFLSWRVLERAGSETKTPAVLVQIQTANSIEHSRIAVVCDRPCKAVSHQLDLPGAQIEYGSVGEWANVAVFAFIAPNPLPSELKVTLGVESEDGKPPRIVRVGVLDSGKD